MVLNGFKSKIFLTESTGTDLFNTDNSKLKILTPKQMLQRLPIALAQVKAGNNLNEIKQIIYSLYLFTLFIHFVIITSKDLEVIITKCIQKKLIR